ncbi:MAG: hypothetical protein HKM96_04830 [Boseongicola sp.]|nr:hypothetical protein [Silicimonas sp.]NNF90685.1 hypothetical protein [Boseongicola sp.]NNL73541.1 hypothetical protein [Silicimonas sp.]RZV99044.1 MAG: hypothetical protein EX266_16035 [Paracoccaceae bacterium]
MSFWSELSIWEAVGLSGAMIYALNYSLVAFDRVTSRSPRYYSANLVAASLVMASLSHSFNLASVVIQSFFISVSVIGIVRHLGTHPRGRNPSSTDPGRLLRR